MSELSTLSQLLISSAQPPVALEQLVKFLAYVSRLKDDILLAQPAAFNLADYRRPVLPPSIQEMPVQYRCHLLTLSGM